MYLQSGLDLFDHFRIFCLGQVSLTGVHGKGSAPLEFILVLGYQMEMQVAAAVAIGAVVDLIGIECLVDGIGCLSHIREEQVPLLVGNVYQLRNMIFISNKKSGGGGSRLLSGLGGNYFLIWFRA